ncbi:MAG: hypothetical protein EOL97_13045 [Spirochaetia bacterium]|nr:hypothetical protein [Spirochaetia bacterium]
MKKKIALLNILLLALVFSGCSLFNDGPKMTLINDSSVAITSIEVRSYIGVNSKTDIGPSNDSLEDGQIVAVDGEVTYDLPLLAPNSKLYVKVYYNNDASSNYTELTYDSDANFNLKYLGNSNNPVFSISGDGASFLE